MNVPTWIAVPVVAMTVGAAITDVRDRRIPNLITGPALLAGVIAPRSGRGTTGLTDSLLRAAVAGGFSSRAGCWDGWEPETSS